MSPEHLNEYDVLHYENPSLGIADRTFCKSCEFLPDDTRIRVRDTDNRQEGWLIGVMHHPCQSYEYGQMEDYQIVATDDGGVRYLHESYMEYV